VIVIEQRDLTDITIRTARLLLRDVAPGDLASIVRNMNNLAISQFLARPPLPYTDEHGLSFIHAAREGRRSGYWLSCAIAEQSDNRMIGSIGMTLNDEFQRAEIGYWLDEAFWNRGLMTEALRGIIDFGFAEFDLNRIAANHFSDNPASGRVMQKAGMTYEGTLRQYLVRFGEPKDAAYYSILRREWAGSVSG